MATSIKLKILWRPWILIWSVPESKVILNILLGVPTSKCLKGPRRKSKRVKQFGKAEILAARRASWLPDLVFQEKLEIRFLCEIWFFYFLPRNSKYLRQCMSQIIHVVMLNLAPSLPLYQFWFVALLNSLFEMYIFVKQFVGVSWGFPEF